MFPFKITNLLNRSAAFSYDSLKTTSYLDDYIVRGNVFSIQMLYSFTASTPVKFYTNTSAAGAAGLAVFLLPIYLHPDAGTITTVMYEEPEGVSGGAAVSLVNRNLSSTTTSVGQVLGGVSTTSDGTLVGLSQIFGTSATPLSSGSGSGEQANALILDTSKDYLWVLESSDDCTCGIDVTFAQIEV